MASSTSTNVEAGDILPSTSQIVDEVVETLQKDLNGIRQNANAKRRRLNREVKDKASAEAIAKSVDEVVESIHSAIPQLRHKKNQSQSKWRQKAKTAKVPFCGIARQQPFLMSQISGHNVQKDPASPHYARHVLPGMTLKCNKCGALRWKNENLNSCCRSGNVRLPPLEQPPEILTQLTSGADHRSRQFLHQVRNYNTTLAFTSIGVQFDRSVMSKPGVFSYRIHGSLYHSIGSLMPNNDKPPKFAQIYFYDAAMQTEQRLSVMPSLDAAVLKDLEAMMHQLNPYVSIFKTVQAQFTAIHPATDLKLVLKDDIPNLDRRRYNKPCPSDLAAILPGSGETATGYRDIVLSMTDGRLQRINEQHGSYDPLQYPLLFPHGENGWCNGIRSSVDKSTITMMDFYRYRLQARSGQLHLLRCGRLLHQYIVDMYAKIEEQRLNFIKNNQTKIRAELYQGIVDAVAAGDISSSDIGKRVILPSSFIGGPRHYNQLFQDAMGIVRAYGKPDLFVTVTCNPSWPEITRELLPNQTSADRPDICVRVFELKLKEIKEDLFKRGVLGKVIAHIHVIEYQKRGLPHAHLLIILDAKDKPRSADDYDAIVSAELPDEKTESQTYSTVTSALIHGPCGKDINPASPCMIGGVCSKGYPKEFRETSIASEDGYPLYRRRNDGRKHKVKNYDCDNRWVVPHNRYLATKYNCHMNVEICSSVKAVKYLYKYCYKGPDRAIVEVQASSSQATRSSNGISQQQDMTAPPAKTTDEVKQYLDARYVSATEAAWRIFGLRLHEEYPNVVRLPVHLENLNTVCFKEDVPLEEMIDRNSTALTEWFSLNKTDPEASNYLFQDAPKHYVWDISKKKWTKRKRGTSATVGRLYCVQPNEGERYYLRLLLHNVKGATSFDQLRSVNGEIQPSFKEACIRLGLLEDDTEWDNCLSEAASFRTPSAMRQLFATLLLFCEPADPLQLWEKHKDSMSEDYRRRMHKPGGNIDDSKAFSQALSDIQHHLEQHGKGLADFPGLPTVTEASFAECRLLQDELSYDREVLQTEVTRNTSMLYCDQRAIFDTTLKLINDGHGGQIFVDGPGGSGKTFLYNTLLGQVRSQGEIALAVASSGIAALLLEGGRTAHTRFRIPLSIDECSVCNIPVQSQIAELIRRSKLIIWDEAPMSHRYIFEALDRSFKDIMRVVDENAELKPFRGKARKYCAATTSSVSI